MYNTKAVTPKNQISHFYTQLTLCKKSQIVKMLTFLCRIAAYRAGSSHAGDFTTNETVISELL